MTTVHVITALGPTDGPGLVVPAQLLGIYGGNTEIHFFDAWANAATTPAPPPEETRP